MLYAAVAPRLVNVDNPEGWACRRRFLKAIRP
jgi:hypothetical protein